MAADYDNPWKEAPDAYFAAFPALLIPGVHRQADWARPRIPGQEQGHARKPTA
jgi:hypothetical protein